MKRSSSERRRRVKPEMAAVVRVQLQDTDIQSVIRQGLAQFVFDAGLLLVHQVMEHEAQNLTGAPYSRGAEKKNHRWGKQPGSVYLSGQRIPVERPRVRTKGKNSREIDLETYREFSKPDSMNEAVMARMLAGVSMRDYAGTVDTALDGHGISRSAVSRRAVALTARSLEEFYNRRLEEVDLVVLLIDGISIAGTENIVCVGIDVWGRKLVLGLRQGATENHVVCKDMIAELIERGLAAEKDYLFLLDGSKALSKAVKQVFGQDVAIQRCQAHKRRNVSDYLPNEHKTRIDKKLGAAYAMADPAEAQKALLSVHNELERLNPAAANSLAEGMTETLTVHRLSVGNELRRSLCTTNIIESMFSMARRNNRNVKNWKDQKHIERWLVTGLLAAECRLRRVRGYRELKDLQRQLKESRQQKHNAEAA